ncbi:MAG: glycosylase [Solobacterium sp.]|nr:glycosylase [Solobacterium sp.]
MPEWLKDAVFYEIYPPSFKDTNGDGIGDLNGIIAGLDYVRDLGCNALWLNPVFDSPFLDGGYDIRDYKKVAPRYGTEADLIRLFAAAHERGIRVLLDLVPGHTSDTHAWFQASCRAESNEYWGRYVWTDHPFAGIAGHPYISGMKERGGAYMLNFFASQPALNYGWLNRTEKWMSAVDAPEALATREAMKDVMRYWLEKGCDGFRVDMADSLVKNDDENKSATAAIWRDVRNMLDREYPEAALVSEWSNPVQAINGGGFHMDFYLDHAGNGYNTLLRDYENGGEDRSYFRKDSGGDIRRFLDDYLPKYEQTRDSGYIAMFTCNHDTPRPARTLSAAEMKLYFAFLMTMPGVPFVYYGDEIGMTYRDLPTKEGGYQRTGSRTPMQWDHSLNLGFSTADPDRLYLPVEPLPEAVTVSAQEQDPASLLAEAKKWIAWRHRCPDLQADAPFAVLAAPGGQDVFAYSRGELVCVLNVSGTDRQLKEETLSGRTILALTGKAKLQGDTVCMGPQSFALLG